VSDSAHTHTHKKKHLIRAQRSEGRGNGVGTGWRATENVLVGEMESRNSRMSLVKRRAV